MRRSRDIESSASPHTRGWTAPDDAEGVRPGGFPAHAGMDPSGVQSVGTRIRLPRTRGDGPSIIAGHPLRHQASPHTRGWTRLSVYVGPAEPGFPAHAGMDRCLRK